jgi:hypothetical protein
MSEKEIIVLLREIQASLQVLDDIKAFHDHLVANEMKMLGRSQASAALLAEVFTSFYTCCETSFVRIAKFFENNLGPSKWHRELLDRMILDFPGSRPRVLRESTYQALEEFLRFRHFKRYYFQFEYDWQRLDYLQQRFIDVFAPVKADLELFARKIREMAQ